MNAESARSIQAVIFDLDDTLFLERDYVRSGYAAVAEEMRRRYGGTVELEDWMWAQFCAGRRSGMFDAACRHFGLDVSADQIQCLVRLYRDHQPRISPAPEAVKALWTLRGRVKLGLLSDGFLPAQELKLAALNLPDVFDAIVFTEDLGRECWKPSPAGFQRIALQLGVPHPACVYVADNPAKDFVAPNALGWLSIQWRQAGQVHADNLACPGGQPQLVVHTVEELLSALLSND